MQRLIINGGNKLMGEVVIQGAKNAALPIMAAAVLCGGEVVLRNCPRLSDVYAAMRIINHLGCKARFCEYEKNTALISAQDIANTEITDALMREMRSSVFFLGALSGRAEKCRISLPGGCDIGRRPIDIHIAALRKMGAVITEEHGSIVCTRSGRLKGARIALSFPSVGATENVILAAATADGITEMTNAAREPEIADLAAFLNKCGADICGAGSGTVVIRGKEKLHGCEYTVMPDRIAAATYLSCAAATGGEIAVKGCVPHQLDAVNAVFEQSGCKVRTLENTVILTAPERLSAVDMVRTTVYPGFPTDCQAFVMAALCKARGTTVFVENIFENRYRHTGELQRMGANIRVEGKVAVVEGVKSLYGANVSAPDLRGGAGLVTAALSAEGQSEVSGVRFIDRGYEDIEKVLCSLGADIRRENP